jgi:hypothetical protein
MCCVVGAPWRWFTPLTLTITSTWCGEPWALFMVSHCTMLLEHFINTVCVSFGCSTVSSSMLMSFELLHAVCFINTYSWTMNSSYVYMIIPRSNFIGQWMRIGGTFSSVKHWTLFIWHVILCCHFHGCNWIYLMTENCILAQVVICRLLSVDVWFESKAGPCGVCSGQSGMGTDFSPGTVVFRCHNSASPSHSFSLLSPVEYNLGS